MDPVQNCVRTYKIETKKCILEPSFSWHEAQIEKMRTPAHLVPSPLDFQVIITLG